MTDLYVRRGETTNVRKRVTILVLLVCALVACVVLLLRSCEKQRVVTMDESELPELLTVEDTLAASPSSDSNPTRSPAPDPAEPRPAPRDTRPDQPNTTGEAPATQAATRGGTDQHLRRATQLQESGALQESREVYLQIFHETKDPQVRSMVMKKLGDVGMELLFTPRPMPEKEEYTVQSGDSLAKLAKKFGTTIDLIKKNNNISGSMIKIGDRLRIFSGTFSLSIDKATNILDLYLNDVFFKRYRVGTGQYNRTPVGDFTITDRIAQPTWWRPDGKSIPYGDPTNELGTHWMSLDIRGYGIHGTWEPETIGKQASAGCVRLVNEEIEELYSILPIGTSVTITE